MDEYTAETFEESGFTVKIIQDQDPMSPRDGDGNGHMICFHRNYDLGDEHDYKSNDFSGWEEIAKQIEIDNGPCIILPLGLIDHSGISMYVGATEHWCDPGGWDSGQVGFIYATLAEVREWYGVKKITKQVRQRAIDSLRSIVEEYDKYLTGDVWGYVIEDEDGEDVDSCWGFIGLKYCKQEAVSAARCSRNYETQQVMKIAEVMAL